MLYCVGLEIYRNSQIWPEKFGLREREKKKEKKCNAPRSGKKGLMHFCDVPNKVRYHNFMDP